MNYEEWLRWREKYFKRIMYEEELKKMAELAKTTGDNNLAIVLHVYLGSKKAGADGSFASHCQDFAKQGLGLIKEMKSRNN